MRCASIGIGLLPVALAACSGEGPSTVPSEPIQVSGGQFISGLLPGTAPGVPSKVPAGTLEVTGINLQPRPLGAGWANQAISGLVTSDATSVGVEFADMGTGYWVVVVGSTDTNAPGQSDFSFTANFNISQWNLLKLSRLPNAQSFVKNRTLILLTKSLSSPTKLS